MSSKKQRKKIKSIYKNNIINYKEFNEETLVKIIKPIKETPKKVFYSGKDVIKAFKDMNHSHIEEVIKLFTNKTN